MVAYAHYSTDARIKAYVRIIEKNGGKADVISLKEPDGREGTRIGETRVFPVMKKYQGSSSFSYIASYLLFFFIVLIRLNILYFRERYDAVHVHNMPNFLIFVTVIPRLLGARCILDIHDLMPVLYSTKFRAGEKGYLSRMLHIEQAISIWFASHVICADHLQHEYLRDTCRVPESKMTVIMNLPYPDLFKPVPQADRQNGEPLRLVYHGTIAERLGVDILLKAVARVKDDITVHLSIYGTGDYLDAAIALSGELGLQDHVYFSRASFPVEDIPEIVGTMDIGVIPNRKNNATDRYMLPVKLMEYVYLRIPVIAPKLAIIRHYFGEGMIKYYEAENIAELAKCFIELYRDPKQRSSQADNAFTIFSEYNWKGQEKEYLGLLRSIEKGTTVGAHIEL